MAATDRRSNLPLSALTLGVKCGGSDGLSGLTANPLVGRMADAVAGAGGKVILTEIPEIFGAEQLLMDRAASRQVFDETEIGSAPGRERVCPCGYSSVIADTLKK